MESPFEDQDLDPGIKVYRAINPKLVNWDRQNGKGFPEMGSQNFQHMSEGRARSMGYAASAMSVVLSHLLEEHDQGPERVLDEFGEDWGIAFFTVADVRSVKPDVGICEDPTEGAPWHGLVFAKTRPKMKGPESQALRAVARLIRSPARV